MIIDAFLVNDEIDLVEFRLSYLAPVVDTVLIGESSETFSGIAKGLNFRGLHDGVRVFHIQIPNLTEGLQGRSRWHREEFQRDFFLEQVRKHSSTEDVVLFCDVDEIPSVPQIYEAEALLRNNQEEFVNLVTPVFFRFLNWKVPSQEFWSKAKAFRSQTAFAGIRYSTGSLRTKEVGAHLSYLGLDAESMRKKYSDFSHSELDKSAASAPVLLDLADEYGVSHTGGFLSKDWGLLSSVEAEQLGEVQLFALGSGFGEIGPSDFNNISRLSRIAVSRRITRAIRKSDINMLIPRSACLETLNLLFCMFSVRLLQYLRSVVRLLLRVALGARRFEGLSFRYHLRKMG